MRTLFRLSFFWPSFESIAAVPLKISVKLFCLFVIMGAFAFVVIYLMLCCFHTSWDAGVPILEVMAPVVSFVIAIGARVSMLMSLKWIVPSTLEAL